VSSGTLNPTHSLTRINNVLLTLAIVVQLMQI